MLLTFDISNTTIKAGVFQDDTLLADWRVATERARLTDEYAMLMLSLFQASGVSAKEINGVAISCVVPPLRAVFAQLARRYLHVNPVVVGPDTRIGVKLMVDNPHEVGADRIVNAFYKAYERVCLMAFSEEELAEVRPLAAPVVQFFQDRWQLEYVEKIGDPSFIEGLVTGDPEHHADFVIVEPGGRVTMEMFF